jgi:hypothetical protein
MDSRRRRRHRNIEMMYHVLEHSEKHLTKKKRVEPRCTGQQWVFDNLGNSKDCYDMFRMHRPCFDSLHDTLVENMVWRGQPACVLRRHLECFYGLLVVHNL